MCLSFYAIFRIFIELEIKYPILTFFEFIFFFFSHLQEHADADIIRKLTEMILFEHSSTNNI